MKKEAKSARESRKSTSPEAKVTRELLSSSEEWLKALCPCLCRGKSAIRMQIRKSQSERDLQALGMFYPVLGSLFFSLPSPSPSPSPSSSPSLFTLEYKIELRTAGTREKWNERQKNRKIELKAT